VDHVVGADAIALQVRNELRAEGIVADRTKSWLMSPTTTTFAGKGLPP
jgi:hypothetical protein